VLLDAPISPDGLFGPHENCRGTWQHVNWLQPAERPQRQRPQHPPRRQGSLQKPAGFNLSVNKLQSSLTKPTVTNLSLAGLAAKACSF